MLLYNIAASQDIMYCRPPGPRESPHLKNNGSAAVPPHFLFFLSLSLPLSLSWFLFFYYDVLYLSSWKAFSLSVCF
jgi:hypothetical protein